MGFDFWSRAAKILQEKKRYRRWLAIFLCLATGVTFGTVVALKMYGQAMTHQVNVLDCQAEIHEHTDDCYDEDEQLICGYADYVVHVHNDDCYDAKGALVCPLEEKEPHEHTDDCYEEEKVLVCEEDEEENSTEEQPEQEETEPENDVQEAKEESEAAEATSEESVLICENEEHEHTDSCYQETLTCDIEEHGHGDGCYDTQETLVCDEDEHEHGDGCYNEDGELTCEKDEHEHGSGCYETEEIFVCEKDEHEHGDGCYEKELTCEKDEHKHDDSCYQQVEVAAKTSDKEEAVEEAPLETTEPKETEEKKEGHTHTDECYETKTVLTCGELELHTHTDECYDEDSFDEDGNLIEGSLPVCGLLQLEEHIHTSDCFKTVELTPEEIAAMNGGATLHIHDESCYDEEGNLICGFDETHIHSLECYDEDGNLICGYDTEEDDLEEVFDNEKEYKNESYIVTAKYNDDAEIPEEAELQVEQITIDSDQEHYTQREAEYQEVMGDENASMKALMKIGFYLDGEEIEPKTPVTITIQFLDEDGLEEGSPITVVHFGEEGSEKLDGGKVTDNSTTFKMNSFSEIAIGYGSEETTVIGTPIQINQDFEYEGEAFHITFHVEGEAVPVSDTDILPETETDGEETAPLATPAEGMKTLEATEEQNTSEALTEGAENSEVSEAPTENVEESEVLETRTEDESVIDAEGAEVQTLAENAENEKLEFRVEPMKEDTEEYKAVTNYTEELEDEKELLYVQALACSMFYEDTELNLSSCQITANVTPTETLNEYKEDESEITLSAIGTLEDSELSEPKLDELGDVVLGEEDNLIFTVETSKPRFALFAAAGASGNVTVQYYANLKVVDGWNSYDIGACLDEESKIKTKDSLEKIYESIENCNFNDYINYEGSSQFEFEKFLEDYNKFASGGEDAHYDLSEIWVLKSGHNLDSKEKEDWDIYLVENSMNIPIQEGAVIRLVGKPREGTHTNDVEFYDYDITDGNWIEGYDCLKLGLGWNYKGINIYRKGINSIGNYETRDPETADYGFGNGLGTGINEKDGANLVNCNNGGPYAGLVGGLNSHGYPEFTVNAPPIFGPESAEGKREIEGYSLEFKRFGDVYTLTSVSNGDGVVENAKELEKFKDVYPKSNQFWPMDGETGRDGNLGKEDTLGGWETVVVGKGAEPLYFSDDKKDHNWFFGMNFSIDFQLTSDYVGPLNYYFYGDDDLWVYLIDLDGDGGSQLVCDLGGVHSSMGAYVDLWNYITKGDSGSYRLSFFYTERGASGSCCWMQFSLPTTKSSTPDTEISYDTLKISKKVESELHDETEFEFEITLKDKEGNLLAGPYQTDKDEELTLINGKGTFKLKDSESITIKGLPENCEYTIKEVNAGDYESWYKINGNNEAKYDDGSVGHIIYGRVDSVECINKIPQEDTYELPETGGAGTIPYTTAGALCIMLGAGVIYSKKARKREV